MAREYSIKEFKRETIHFCDGVDLSVEIGYSNGQPICKTDSVVLDYLGKKYYATRDASSDESIYKLIVKDNLESIYVVELVNHLDRNNNDSNRFEVYHSEVSDKHPEDLDVYVFGNIMDVVRPRARPNQNQDKSDSEILYLRYNECYDLERRKFNKDILIKHINPKFEYVYRDYNFTHVPTYGYVNKSGKASKTAQPIMHLAIITNILAHQDKFALINNQEAVASFNSIMKSKRLNTTVETVTNADTTDEVRLLKSMLADKTQECATLNDKLDKALEKLDIITKDNEITHGQLTVANNQLTVANNQLTETNNKLTEANNQLTETNNKLTETNDKLDTANKKIDGLITSHRELKDSIKQYTTSIVEYTESKMPAESLTSGTTKEVLIVFFREETSDDIRQAIITRNEVSKVQIDIEKDDLFYDTVVVQDLKEDEELEKHNYDPETDRIIFRGYCNNSLDLFKNFALHVPSNIARSLNMKQRYTRKIICKEANEEKLKEKLTLYANRSLIIKNGLLSMMKSSSDIIINHINNQLEDNGIDDIRALTKAINRNTKAINKNTKAIESLVSLLEKLHPDARFVWYNHGYRAIYKEGNDVYCDVLKNSDSRHKLTLNEIKTSKFK